MKQKNKKGYEVKLPTPSDEAVSKSKELIKKLKISIRKNSPKKLSRNILRCSIGQ